MRFRNELHHFFGQYDVPETFRSEPHVRHKQRTFFEFTLTGTRIRRRNIYPNSRCSWLIPLVFPGSLVALFCCEFEDVSDRGAVEATFQTNFKQTNVNTQLPFLEHVGRRITVFCVANIKYSNGATCFGANFQLASGH